MDPSVRKWGKQFPGLVSLRDSTVLEGIQGTGFDPPRTVRTVLKTKPFGYCFLTSISRRLCFPATFRVLGLKRLGELDD